MVVINEQSACRMHPLAGAPRVHNDRILAVPAVDQRYSDIADLPKRLRDELEMQR